MRECFDINATGEKQMNWQAGFSPLSRSRERAGVRVVEQR